MKINTSYKAPCPFRLPKKFDSLCERRQKPGKARSKIARDNQPVHRSGCRKTGARHFGYSQVIFYWRRIGGRQLLWPQIRSEA